MVGTFIQPLAYEFLKPNSNHRSQHKVGKPGICTPPSILLESQNKKRGGADCTKY
jgi:hypothetical protein